MRGGGFPIGIAGYLTSVLASGTAFEEAEEFLKKREGRLKTVKSSRLKESLRRADGASWTVESPFARTGRDGFWRTEKLSCGRRVAKLFCSIMGSKGVG